MIRNNIKKAIAIALMSTALIGVFSTGASAAWKKDSSGWWYTEGSSWATGWRQINGKWYYFSPTNGYMFTDTTVNGYFLDRDGAWVNDTNFNIKASKAEELIRQKCYPGTSSTNPYIHCAAFDGNKWTVRAYEDNEFKTTNIGWYYVYIATGQIVEMNTGKTISYGETTKNEEISSSDNNVEKAKNLIYKNIDDEDKMFLENGITYASEVTQSTTTDLARNIYKATGIKENLYKFNGDLGGTFYVGKETGKTYLFDKGGSLGCGFYLLKNGVRIETWAETRRTNWEWKSSTSGADWLNAFPYNG